MRARVTLLSSGPQTVERRKEKINMIKENYEEKQKDDDSKDISSGLNEIYVPEGFEKWFADYFLNSWSIFKEGEDEESISKREKGLVRDSLYAFIAIKNTKYNKYFSEYKNKLN